MTESKATDKEREAFEKWYDAQPEGKLNPFDVFKAGIDSAVSAGHACVFALDHGGNLYRRYREPQCLSSRDEATADAEGLDWLEQCALDPYTLAELVQDWTWNGKRYPSGLRAAIDAAIASQRTSTEGKDHG